MSISKVKRGFQFVQQPYPDPIGFDGLVYLASPKTTYSTQRYSRLLADAGRLMPHARILPARGLYENNRQWREAWPIILDTIAALIFFTTPRGSIGWGVWREIRDTVEHDKPVWLLRDSPGKQHPALIPFRDVDFEFRDVSRERLFCDEYAFVKTVEHRDRKSLNDKVHLTMQVIEEYYRGWGQRRN
jgi:hypothetical protein